MNELMRRLAARPWITAELILASFFANLLALASPLFVIQVLNRYVTYGIDVTLLTLTVGVIAAIILELGFRQARHLLAASALEERDEERAVGAYGILSSAKLEALEQIPPGNRREIMRGLDSVETAYSAPNIGAVLDVPFALVFIIALALLNPLLGLIATGFILFAFCFSLFSQRIMQGPTQQISMISAVGNGLVTTAARAADTLRLFGGHDKVMEAWRSYVKKVQGLRQLISGRQGLTQTLTQSLQALMSVAIIAVGAILVVQGELDVGVMIGANILAARGLGPVLKFAQMTQSFAKAKQALAEIRQLARLPLEADEGSALSEYSGNLELRDVAFGYPGQAAPLFESLNLSLAPGSVLIVRGRNGAGKTTLMRLLAGLMEPSRGQIFGDGVDTRQMAPAWWRRQIVYLPQEPTFINTTVADNLMAANPEMDEDGVNRVIREAGLGRFIDESQRGLETEITDNGYALAVGIRRRLGLARALASEGRLVLFDEPTEGLDKEGCAAVYAALRSFAEERRTIIIVTNDPLILKGARVVLDLNSKPAPKLVTLPQPDTEANISSLLPDEEAAPPLAPPAKPKAAKETDS